MNKRGLTDLGYLLFLDRYAVKDGARKTLTVGDVVLIKVDNQKMIGTLLALDDNEAIVSVDEEKHFVSTDSIDKPMELDPKQMWQRTAEAVAGAEITAAKYEVWIDKFNWLLEDWKFLPGGRILAGAGTNTELTLYNCYVIPSPKDSKDEIFKTLNLMSQIMSRGGGVGINISTLRPRYAYARKTNGRSSGAVSWGELYSYTTGLIEQAGCIAGDSLIATAEGNIPIRDLIGQRPWVYSFDNDAGQVVLKQANWVGKTGVRQEVYKLQTDKGLILYATPDHLMLCRDGEYRHLKDLKPDNRLMPLIRKLDKCWYGSYDNFLHTLELSNHRVECVEFSHYEDVYDMEVPGTNNFAVVMPGDQSSGGIFIHNSRRGALMLILNDWHPDLLEFINVKRDSGKIINANISVGISDEFMQAVAANETWDLKFPDTTHPDYDETWDGDLKKWIDSGKPVKIYKTHYARDLWNAIIESAWACAEPGIWFSGRANAYSNSQYYAPLISTNPCAEQPLPANAVCLLGALNLAKFVKHRNNEWVLDIEDLERAIGYAVRFLDNVIDVTPYITLEIEMQQKSERRIGLGTMGLAELLIRLKLRYGSDEAVKYVDDLYKFIAITAYEASIQLAAEKGAFPKFDLNGMLRSKFMQQLPMRESTRNKFIEHGLRNVTLLTQAPTGTIGTMVNTSTGIEPFYFWEYERKGRFGSHIERVAVYEEWADSQELPHHFVTAQDLTPAEHVKMQAAIQLWIDSSISKTCNVPSNYTAEQVGELYELMYKLGCKGGTVYRDGSRSEQVLNLTMDKSTNKSNATCLEPSSNADSLLATWRKRPDKLNGTTYHKSTPVGTAYITINYTEDDPFEIFINIGRAGSDIAADAEGLGRLISLILRMPSQLSIKERIENIAAQLHGIGSGRSQGFGKNRVMSLPDAIAQILLTHVQVSDSNLPNLPEAAESNGDVCPGCGNYTLQHIEGCKKCFHCGHSEC